MRGCVLGSLALLAMCLLAWAQEPPPTKLKTAKIDWIADTPLLVYDIHYTGAETMPTPLKTLVKDIAESEGFYLTGEDKSKTVSSQSKRISIDYVKSKSKPKQVRIGKVEVKEKPASVDCTVTFSKKPSDADLTKLDGILETFARKYRKATKTISSSVKHKEGPQPTVWAFEVQFKDPAKEKK